MMASAESNLDLALNEFQQHLSPEQKAEFDSTAQGVPAPNAVVLLSSEISSKSSDRKSHVLAGRMRVVLEAIQQYSSIADTAASVHPVAGLVWTCAKTVIQLSLNFAGYFEKLSERFAQLSAYCPRYGAYEALFKQSRRVRDSLENFYAIIVKFCTRALKVMQEKGVKHFAKSLWKTFKNDFGQLEENLSAARQDVDEEIQLASEQKMNTMNQQLQVISREVQFQRWQQTVEMQENRAFRAQQSLALAKSADLKKQQIMKDAERKKIRVVDLVCDYDYTKSQCKASRLRCDGTATWLFERAEFKEWIDEPKPVCLWCSGSTGCGKTVLAGQVVEQVGKFSTADVDTAIVYYYFTSERKDSLSPLTFLRSLLYQIIRTKKLTANVQERLEEIFVSKVNGQKPDIEEVEKLLIDVYSTVEKIVLVIDGMNEAEQADQKKVLKFLKTLTDSTTTIKVFVTSQPELDLQRIFDEGAITHIGIKPYDNLSEVEKFINSRIEKELHGGALAICEPGIIEDMKRILKLKAKGMFLWVELQIRAICDICEEDETSEGVSSLLVKLPEELGGIYTYALEKIFRRNDDQIQTIKKMFQWAYCARRPLTIDELHDALTVNIGQKTWREPTKKFRPSTISRLCGNLIIFDDADKTVSLAHHTVRAFIESPPTMMMASYAFTGFTSDIRMAEDYLACICLTYLSFADFQKALTARSRPNASSHLSQPLLLAAHGLAGSHTTQMPGLNRLVLPFTRRSNRYDFDTEFRLKKAQPQRIDPSFQLLNYCIANWNHHCRRCFDDNDHHEMTTTKAKGLLAKLTIQPCLPFSWQPWDPPDDLDPFPRWQMFLWAVQNLHPCVLLSWFNLSDRTNPAESWDLLLETRTLVESFDHVLQDDTHSQNEFFCAMQDVIPQTSINNGLYVAAELDLSSVLTLCLKLGADVNGTRHFYSNTRLLLSTSMTPLKVAARSGHLAIAEILIEKGAWVDASSASNDLTALQLAVQGGYTAIVELLLQHDAKTEHPLTGGRMAVLQSAAAEGYGEVMKCLLKHDPTLWNDCRGAFCAAAERGHLNIINFMLEERIRYVHKGLTADAWAKFDCQDALRAARRNNHGAVVKKLRSIGVR